MGFRALCTKLGSLLGSGIQDNTLNKKDPETNFDVESCPFRAWVDGIFLDLGIRMMRMMMMMV